MTPLNVLPLQIDSLMAGSLIVPYSDVLKDGKTPINVPVNNVREILLCASSNRIASTFYSIVRDSLDISHSSYSLPFLSTLKICS